MKFTKDQERAYKAYGHNVLVSAGAGSGKTQVLSERVRYLVQEHGYKIDEFLILTFTNLAAGEMKERIRKKLKEINSPEADKVDNAYISTFDSFALNIVKKYYYYLNVSKDISMIDSNALNVFVYNKIDEILERRYLKDDVLTKLSLVMNNKDDNSLKELIFKVFLKASSATDEEEYFNNLLSNHDNRTLMKCLKVYEDILDECVNKILEYSSFCESNPKFGEKYQVLLQPYLDASTLDEKVLSIKSIPPRGYPSFTKNIEEIENKEHIVFYKEKLKDAVEYFDDSQSLFEELKDQKEFTSLIIDIVKEILIDLRKYKIVSNLIHFLILLKWLLTYLDKMKLYVVK
jgi:ATP-dependent helicase/nuclease subunit A